MALAERDVRASYKQAALGMAWALLSPVLQVVFFTLIFSRVKAFHVTGVPYAIYAYVGILCWTYFAGSLSSGGNSMIGNINLLQKTQFPRECFPLSQMLEQSLYTTIGLIPLGILMAYNGFAPKPEALWFPLFIAIEIIFTAGVVLAMAALIVYVRDLIQVMAIIIQLGLFATPVIWPLVKLSDVTWGPLHNVDLRPYYCFFNPSGRSSTASAAPCFSEWRPIGPSSGSGRSVPSCTSSSGTPSSNGSRWGLPTSADGSIVVEQLWKRFRADRGRPRLNDQLAKIGGHLTGKEREWRWVLKDINFAVEPGGTMGLIGINGSGKSTLLEVLSRTMYQTAGRCEIQGRLGALLEVRGGIHPAPDRAREHLHVRHHPRPDTQAGGRALRHHRRVRRGVRCHRPPGQVLLERHAGAARLLHRRPPRRRHPPRRRGAGRRRRQLPAEVPEPHQRGGGRTARRCCSCRTTSPPWRPPATKPCGSPTPWCRAAGPTRDVLAQYRAAIEEHAALTTTTEPSVRVLKVEVTGPDGGPPQSAAEARARLVLSAPKASKAKFVVGVSQGTAAPIFVVRHERQHPAGDFELHCTLANLPLPQGHYSLWLAVIDSGDARPAQEWRPVGSFDVFGPTAVRPPQGAMVLSPVYVEATWDLT